MRSDFLLVEQGSQHGGRKKSYKRYSGEGEGDRNDLCYLSDAHTHQLHGVGYEDEGCAPHSQILEHD